MSHASKNALAAETWRLLLDYLIATSPARSSELSKRNLMPNDAKALYSLDRKEGQPMGSLARAWNCDPSMATWIISRLERMDLVERRPDPADGRVKQVLLTRRGEKMKAELMAAFRAPPPEILGLSNSELESVRRVMEKLIAERKT